MISNSPLITCICITKERPQKLKIAIHCFKLQTYENKELLILHDDDDLTTNEIILKENDSSIRSLRINAKLNFTLGELRNLAVLNSLGELVCQWDDDDWYHIGRLDYQYNIIFESKMKGSILLNWIIFDQLTKKAYISNARLWEGSLMCYKDVLLKYKYEDKRRGEDSELVKQLYIMDYLFVIQNAPNIYIYIYHGNNTFGEDHFAKIFKFSESQTEMFSLQINKILNKELPEEEDSFIIDKLLNNPIFE